jgi:DNA-binding transcriptional LysR family regulator
MEWEQLGYFRAVGRTQNVTRAAEQLGMTQPALSRSLGRLERELAVPLFERAGRNVRMTRYGEAFLPYVERALRELEEGRRELADLSGVEHGIIAFGFLFTLGVEVVPELVRDFKAQQPNVRFDLSQSPAAALERALVAGDLDLCLTSGPVTNPRLAWKRLGDEELILIVPKGHRLAKRRSVRLHEASSDPFVSYKPNTAMRELGDELCRKAGFVPAITFEGEESGTIAGFVAAGLGVAIVPTATPHTSGTARLHITEPVAGRSIGVIWMKDRYLPASARAFRDYIIRSGDHLRRKGGPPG